MKTKISLLVCLFLPMLIFGQDKVQKMSEIKVTPPVFAGVEHVVQIMNNENPETIDGYLNRNVQYPVAASNSFKQGVAVVQFEVTPSGELANFKTINSVCREVDKELIRVLQTTAGMWKPGYNNDIPVAMNKEVSMMFVAELTNRELANRYFTNTAKYFFKKGNDLFLSKTKLKRALRNYDLSILYMPYETSSLLMRGLCRYEMGDKEGACSDWNRINALGKDNVIEFIDNLCELKGYAEMKQILHM